MEAQLLKIAIIGIGGMGGYFGAKLARAGMERFRRAASRFRKCGRLPM